MQAAAVPEATGVVQLAGKQVVVRKDISAALCAEMAWIP